MALTDLSLTTLMMFVLFFLVVFLASLSENLPQWVKNVDQLKAQNQELKTWSEKVQSIKEMQKKEKLKLTLQELKQALGEEESSFNIDEAWKDKAITKSLYDSIAEIILKQGQVLVGKEESRSEESAMNELHRQLKQEIHSLKQSLQNPYLNTSKVTPLWKLKVKETGQGMLFSFPRGSQEYTIADMEHILGSLNPGDGIQVMITGFDSLGTFSKALLLNTFEEYGIPPLSIINFGSKEAMQQWYGIQPF